MAAGERRSGRRATAGAVLVVAVLAVVTSCVPPAPPGPSTVPADPPVDVSGPAALVDPFVGTAPAAATSPVPGGRAGDTFPGATVPFGAIQWSPDTPGAEHPAGYAWDDTSIDGFSLTHFSGAGCDNSGLVRFVPGTGGTPVSSGPFRHDDERARPGSYEVRMGSGVSVSLAAGTRSGLGRFDFPDGSAPVITLDNSPRTQGGVPVLGLPELRFVDDRTVEGSAVGGQFCNAPTQFRMWFRIEFSRPFRVTAQGLLGTATLQFEPSAQPVVARTAVSWVDADGARRNLAAEQPGWSYGQVRDAALARWNEVLGRLTVSGGTERDRRMFATALYHSLLHPNVSSDVDGRYLGFDQAVHTVAPGRVHLANLSGWDVYRSQVQLLAVVVPEVAHDLADSLLDDARQCGGGFPKWSVMNTEASVMNGDPGAVVAANLDAFGAGASDPSAVLEVMRRSAEDPGTQCGWVVLRPGLRSYLERGFAPTWWPQVTDSAVTGILQRFFGLQPASDTLEYASADGAIAAYARRHGDPGLAARTGARAGNWRNVFDPNVGSVRPRLVDGTFAQPFDPASTYGFTEGNGAQYTWMVPQDVGGLVAALGGRDAARRRLDDLFSQVNGGSASRTSTSATNRSSPSRGRTCGPARPAARPPRSAGSSTRRSATGPTACPATTTWGPRRRGSCGR